MSTLSVSYANPLSFQLSPVLIEISKPVQLKKTTGTEHIGYWALFTSPAGPQIMKDNIDSFLDLLYAEDVTLWKEYINPLGGVDKWLSEKKRCSKGAYISEEEVERHKEVLLKGGFEGPVCYYKIQMSGIAWKDAQGKCSSPFVLSLTMNSIVF
jgi:soluble epoxide hydrolase / lipid-phosphate phosphatase